MSSTSPPPRPRHVVDVGELLASARQGQARAVARLISLIEDGHPAARDIAAGLAAGAGRAHVIGITGSPGVGKSTTTNALVGAYRAQGRRVGVLAVDPSSPFSGGALLGDRIRMQDHVLDPEVYIRSMASRAHLGGLAAATPLAARVFDAAGCDVVLIETVGVGQSEVEVAGLADTTLVLLAPGMGDGIQAAKAGILEIGDVFVVNKADRDGARATVRDVRHMTGYGSREQDGAWRAPVLTAVAVDGTGIDDIVTAVDRHRRHALDSGQWQARRRRRAAAEISALVLAQLQARLGDVSSGARLDALATDVVAGATDPYTAADTLLTDLV